MKRFVARNRLTQLWHWLGRSEVHRAGSQEGQAGTQAQAEAAVHRGPSQGRLSSALNTFQLIESGPPRLSRTISRVRSLIWDFNHIYLHSNI